MKQQLLANIVLLCISEAVLYAQKAIALTEDAKAGAYNFLHSDNASYSVISVSASTGSAYVFVPATMITKNNSILLYHRNGQPQLTAHTKKQRLHQNWQSWYTNGVSCDSGSLQKGIPHGTWKVWYKNGHLKFVRQYHSDLFTTIKNEWLRRPPRSFYPITQLALKNLALANWYTAVQHAFLLASKPAYPLPALLENNTVNNNYYVPPFTEGLLHGRYADYAENGNLLTEGSYRYGLRENEWTEVSRDGKLTGKGLYRHGKKTGVWRYYHNQQIVELIEFSEGKEIYLKKF